MAPVVSSWMGCIWGEGVMIAMMHLGCEGLWPRSTGAGAALVKLPLRYVSLVPDLNAAADVKTGQEVTSKEQGVPWDKAQRACNSCPGHTVVDFQRQVVLSTCGGNMVFSHLSSTASRLLVAHRPWPLGCPSQMAASTNAACDSTAHQEFKFMILQLMNYHEFMTVDWWSTAGLVAGLPLPVSQIPL